MFMHIRILDLVNAGHISCKVTFTVNLSVI